MADVTDSLFKQPQNSLNAKQGEYPSPFLDIGTFLLPNSFRESLDLCTMFWMKHGVYRAAAERITRYFITEIDFTQDEESRKELSEYLNTTFNVTKKAAAVGDDLMSCGLTASSMIFPFNRFLRCPRCSSERSIEQASWEYSGNAKFRSSCGHCDFVGDMSVVDRKSFDKDRVFMQRWSPYDLTIKQHPWSGRTEVYWDIPADIRQRVKSGDKFIVKDFPIEFLKTVEENRIFKFNRDFVCYGAEDTIASVDLKGYGLPKLMANFAQAFYVQTLKKANSTLAQDYMVPFRLLSPSKEPTDNQGPWMAGVDNELINNSVREMVSNHRQNPTGWNFSPIPMNYQAMSGEGTMTTPDLLKQGVEELLAGMGMAPELFYGSMNLEAAPIALRVMEQSWPEITSFLNRWLNFVVSRTTRYMGWETPDSIKFKRVTLADDMERRQLLLQLTSSGLVSKRTAFGVWGIDPKVEQERIIEELRSEMEAQKSFQEETSEQEQVQGMLTQQGVLPPGVAGDPSAAAGAAGAPVSGPALNIGHAGTVTEKAQQVDQLAQQLVSMPHGPRMSEMKNLRESDQNLHALVKQRMEELRTQIKGQAVDSVSGGGPV